jgi:hypothetical protein
VWHRIEFWEEIKFNMWGSVNDAGDALEAAIKFTGDHKLYGSFMRRVIVEWPYSCENAFTDPILNRRAWVGHAAVALALGIPEDITRKAWGFLSDEQRLLANKEASRAIAQWELDYRKRDEISGDLEEAVLF